MKLIVYHDLAKENKHGYTFESLEITEQSLVVREMIIPGMHGYPPMYIRHLWLNFKGTEYFIISMTDYELTEAKKFQIVKGVVKLLRQQEQ